MKTEYDIHLRCVTCGCEDRFEYTDYKSYIKCSFCNREYFGGIDELQELNQEAFDEVNKEIDQDATAYIQAQLAKAIKRK